MLAEPKPVRWVGTSLRDVRAFPAPVRREIGHALYAAQHGEKDPAAKPLRGFAGASVLEIVANHEGGTWRTVYTVQLADAIYVLHAFQKKSKRGIATPKTELAMIQRRLEEVRRLQAEKEKKP